MITWVNGNDPNWQEKINTYAPTKIDFKKKKQSIRYNNIGEINFTIKSIVKYAPFIRNIFLVTDDQQPSSFKELSDLGETKGINLKLIDHKTVFREFEQYLPCFNSCSIGSTLFRIPGLAEHFILFNDDTFLMRNTSPECFFIDGKPIIRGKWEKFREDRKRRKAYHGFRKWIGKPMVKRKSSFKRFQQTSAKLAGAERFLRRFHTPVSIRKSTLENFFADNNFLEENLRHRFRHPDQFIISSLSEHLEITNGTYHLRTNARLTYFRSYKSLISVKLKLKLFTLNKSKLFMTFQSLEMADKKILDYVLKWINRRLRTNSI